MLSHAVPPCYLINGIAEMEKRKKGRGKKNLDVFAVIKMSGPAAGKEMRRIERNVYTMLRSFLSERPPAGVMTRKR